MPTSSLTWTSALAAAPSWRAPAQVSSELLACPAICCRLVCMLPARVGLPASTDFQQENLCLTARCLHQCTHCSTVHFYPLPLQAGAQPSGTCVPPPAQRPWCPPPKQAPACSRRPEAPWVSGCSYRRIVVPPAQLHSNAVAFVCAFLLRHGCNVPLLHVLLVLHSCTSNRPNQTQLNPTLHPQAAAR